MVSLQIPPKKERQTEEIEGEEGREKQDYFLRKEGRERNKKIFFITLEL